LWIYLDFIGIAEFRVTRDEFAIQFSFDGHSIVIQWFYEDGDLEFESWNLEFIENN